MAGYADVVVLRHPEPGAVTVSIAKLINMDEPILNSPSS